MNLPIFSVFESNILVNCEYLWIGISTGGHSYITSVPLIWINCSNFSVPFCILHFSSLLNITAECGGDIENTIKNYLSSTPPEERCQIRLLK